MIILRKIRVKIYYQPFQFEPDQKIPVAMRVMRKEINVFILQLPIYYILEQEISIGVNADI